MVEPESGAGLTPVRAAGGVLYRGSGAETRIAVIHRPRLDDWSLPKGKRKRGEHPIVNAYREVFEETGVHGRLGARLPSVAYQVLLGGELVDKTVDYWAMTCGRDDGFVPGDETDGLAWLSLDEAHQRLSYERDILVVSAFANLPALRPPIVVVRHASAGDPQTWSGADAARPLDEQGVARAITLAEVLGCFSPWQLISAEPRRCVETLEPLATATGLAIQLEPAFNEEADHTRAAERLPKLAAEDGAGATVICSQGKLIPPVLAQLTGGQREDYRTPKGRGWVLNFALDGSLATVDALE